MDKNTLAQLERVAANIKAARKNKKMSQRDLAKAIGSKSHYGVQLIESGTHNFTLDTLCRISEALGVNISELIK